MAGGGRCIVISTGEAEWRNHPAEWVLAAGDWGLGNPISHRYPNRQQWISVSVDSEVLICKYQYGALFNIAAAGNRPFPARYARLLGVVKGK